MASGINAYHSLLRQMAAQKQEKYSNKMKNIHNYRRKIKRKTIKSKSEYAIRASLISTLPICPGKT